MLERESLSRALSSVMTHFYLRTQRLLVTQSAKNMFCFYSSLLRVSVPQLPSTPHPTVGLWKEEVKSQVFIRSLIITTWNSIKTIPMLSKLFQVLSDRNTTPTSFNTKRSILVHVNRKLLQAWLDPEAEAMSPGLSLSPSLRTVWVLFSGKNSSPRNWRAAGSSTLTSSSHGRIPA